MKEKVVVGMSGGVDSSVAAKLLLDAGYEVIGVTMQIWQDDSKAGRREAAENGGCCALTAVTDAKRVADQLGIPHYVADFREVFRREVMDAFDRAYFAGRTPNPCVLCNRAVKWESLLRKARELGAEYIATGHYGRVLHLDSGRYAVAGAVSAKKDQSYALYRLTQEQLAHTLMPVGMYEKKEIRAMAEKMGLSVADKPDSQEICFIPDHDYARFSEEDTGVVSKPGNFVTADGRVLGRHKGIIHYTVGQRKGLGLSMGHPVFVTEIRPETDEVVIGEAEDLMTDRLVCGKLNFMGWADLSEPRPVTAKIRYNHPGAPAVIRRTGADEITRESQKPARAVTPGQAAVPYDGEILACGGEILR